MSQTKDSRERGDAIAAAARFRKLVERWGAEDPAYDREAWPELKEALDQNRPEYRKLFPEASEDLMEATEG